MDIGKCIQLIRIHKYGMYKINYLVIEYRGHNILLI